MRIPSHRGVTPEEYEAEERARLEAWRDKSRAEHARRQEAAAARNSPEYKRARSRHYNARYRLRHKGLRPTHLLCNRCGTIIEPNELATLARRSASTMELNPYVDLSNGSRWTGAFHASCLPPLPLHLSDWRLPKGAQREAICEVCARRIRPPRWYRRRDGTGYVYYCSPGCGPGALQIARRVQHNPVKCETCGEAFTPDRADQRYCPGGACRQKAYRRRRALDSDMPTS